MKPPRRKQMVTHCMPTQGSLQKGETCLLAHCMILSSWTHRSQMSKIRKWFVRPPIEWRPTKISILDLLLRIIPVFLFCECESVLSWLRRLEHSSSQCFLLFWYQLNSLDVFSPLEDCIGSSSRGRDTNQESKRKFAIWRKSLKSKKWYFPDFANARTQSFEHRWRQVSPIFKNHIGTWPQDRQRATKQKYEGIFERIKENGAPRFWEEWSRDASSLADHSEVPVWSWSTVHAKRKECPVPKWQTRTCNCANTSFFEQAQVEWDLFEKHIITSGDVVTNWDSAFFGEENKIVVSSFQWTSILFVFGPQTAMRQVWMLRARMIIFVPHTYDGFAVKRLGVCQEHKSSPKDETMMNEHGYTNARMSQSKQALFTEFACRWRQLVETGTE